MHCGHDPRILVGQRRASTRGRIGRDHQTPRDTLYGNFFKSAGGAHSANASGWTFSAGSCRRAHGEASRRS